METPKIIIELTKDQIPQLADWPKGGEAGMTLKLKTVSFVKIVSGVVVAAYGDFEVVSVAAYESLE